MLRRSETIDDDCDLAKLGRDPFALGAKIDEGVGPVSMGHHGNADRQERNMVGILAGFEEMI